MHIIFVHIFEASLINEWFLFRITNKSRFRKHTAQSDLFSHVTRSLTVLNRLCRHKIYIFRAFCNLFRTVMTPYHNNSISKEHFKIKSSIHLLQIINHIPEFVIMTAIYRIYCHYSMQLANTTTKTQFHVITHSETRDEIWICWRKKLLRTL